PSALLTKRIARLGYIPNELYLTLSCIFCGTRHWPDNGNGQRK
ncbi:unnamed protein product, partial [Ectocarpus sp. 8 AP-2014]